MLLLFFFYFEMNFFKKNEMDLIKLINCKKKPSKYIVKYMNDKFLSYTKSIIGDCLVTLLISNCTTYHFFNLLASVIFMEDKILSHTISIIGDCLVTRLISNCPTCHFFNSLASDLAFDKLNDVWPTTVDNEKDPSEKAMSFSDSSQFLFSNKTH